MQLPIFRLALVAGLGASVVACGDSAPSPSEVRSDLTQNLNAIIIETNAALQSGAVQRLPDGVFGNLSGGAGAMLRASAEPTLGSALRRIASLAALESDDVIDAAAVTSRLNSELFSDANHRGDGVYPMPLSWFCATEATPTTGATDPACAQAFAKVAPKIKVSGDSKSQSFALLLGPNEREPLSLSLSRRELTVQLDLAEASLAMKDLASSLGDEVPNVRATGAVALQLAVPRAKVISLKVEVTEPIDFAAAASAVPLDDAEALRFSTAAARAFEITLDGAEQGLAASVGVGLTRLHMPSQLPRAPLDLELGGLTGAALVTPSLPVVLSGLGLGDRALTVDVGGRRALTVDVNPDASRMFSVYDRSSAAGTAYEFSPSLDVRIAADAALLGSDVADYALTRIQLEGDKPTVAEHGDQLKVLAGTLTLTTDPVDYSLTATAEQCVAPVVTNLVEHLGVVPCAP